MPPCARRCFDFPNSHWPERTSLESEHLHILCCSGTVVVIMPFFSIGPKRCSARGGMYSGPSQANVGQTFRTSAPACLHFIRPAYGGALVLDSDAVPYTVFEPLMYRYGVDLVFSGHIHNQACPMGARRKCGFCVLSKTRMHSAPRL